MSWHIARRILTKETRFFFQDKLDTWYYIGHSQSLSNGDKWTLFEWIIIYQRIIEKKYINSLARETARATWAGQPRTIKKERLNQKLFCELSHRWCSGRIVLGLWSFYNVTDPWFSHEHGRRAAPPVIYLHGWITNLYYTSMVGSTVGCGHRRPPPPPTQPLWLPCCATTLFKAALI